MNPDISQWSGHCTTLYPYLGGDYMKRVAMLALVLAFGISCDDSPTSPSDPNVAKFTAILLPSNEVPAITNADAAASGTMQLTMTVTRDSANAITGATYDFTVNYHRLPGEHHADRRAHPQRARLARTRGVVVGLPLTASDIAVPTGQGTIIKTASAEHVKRCDARGRGSGDLQQPGRQLLQRSHDDQHGRRDPRAAGASRTRRTCGRY